ALDRSSFNSAFPITLARITSETIWKHLTVHRSIQKATMSTLPVLISAGAVLGKANLVQLTVMVLIEAATFGATRFADKKVFNVEDHTILMHGHVFGAYFGLLVAWCLSRSLPRGMDEKAQTEKVQMATGSSLFAMLGTLLLWIFWPSFNSALVELKDKKNAVFNTYYALAVSAVTATSMSALSHPQGKINMVHIHNAVLAGGVAVGAPCSLIPSPWIAMVCLNHMLQIQNPGGIHYTFGLPGLLGALCFGNGNGVWTPNRLWSQQLDKILSILQIVLWGERGASYGVRVHALKFLRGRLTDPSSVDL
ncbi:hypothetical protein A6R68_07830, partial [Neotoma lepida]